jgi:hypothetical protein
VHGEGVRPAPRCPQNRPGNDETKNLAVSDRRRVESEPRRLAGGEKKKERGEERRNRYALRSVEKGE